MTKAHKPLTETEKQTRLENWHKNMKALVRSTLLLSGQKLQDYKGTR